MDAFKSKLKLCSSLQNHAGTLCVYPTQDIAHRSLMKLYDQIIDIISQYEDVIVISDSHLQIEGKVSNIVIPGCSANIWVRDYTPLWGIENGALCAIQYQYEKGVRIGSIIERKINDLITQCLRIQSMQIPVWFEGGNFFSDGKIVYLCKTPKFKDNEYCIRLEYELRRMPFIEKIIWVEHGYPWDVCQHLDNVCCLSDNGELIRFQQPKNFDFMANIYLFNGGMLLSDKYKFDAKYLNLLDTCFPGRQRYFLDIEPLVRVHGGLHCILKEIPFLFREDD